MRRFLLSTIALGLVLSGSASAQQRVLVEHNVNGDRCSRFAMRILIPSDAADQPLPLSNSTERIDSRMVWDPCPKDEPQVAMIFSNPAPHQRDVPLLQLPFLFKRPIGENVNAKQGTSLLTPFRPIYSASGRSQKR